MKCVRKHNKTNDMSDREKILLRYIDKESMDELSQNVWNDMLRAMEVYGKQCYIDGTNAGHKAFKEALLEAQNIHQTRTQ